jgi:hypothetical protein
LNELSLRKVRKIPSKEAWENVICISSAPKIVNNFKKANKSIIGIKPTRSNPPEVASVKFLQASKDDGPGGHVETHREGLGGK